MNNNTDLKSKAMATPGKKKTPKTSDAIHDGIAMKLRELYSELENETIPAELLILLDRLDEAERRQKTNGKSREASVDG